MFPRVHLTELHGLSSALTPASSFGFPNQSLTTSIAFGQSNLRPAVTARDARV